MAAIFKILEIDMTS